MRSTKRLGLVVAFAQRQRPGGGQQQARPAVELVGRQPRQPLEHRALAAVRHQRFVQAALGQVVGGLALAGGQRVARGRLEQPVRRQPVGGARVQRRLLVRPAAARSAAAARRAPARACAASRCASPAAKTGVSRASRASRSAASSASATARAQLGMQRVEDRDAGQEGDVGGVEVGQQQVDELVAQRAAAAPPAPTSRPAGRRRRPSPTARAAGRAASPRSARAGARRRRGRPASPKRARTSSIVSSSRKRSCGRADARRTGRRRPGRRCSSWQSARAATTHAQVGRRVAQQVGQRLAGRRAAGGRPRRRSARCRAPTAPPRPARR